MHRRLFLKNASLAVAGATLFGARSLARAAGANARLRVGVVGFSDRARSSLIPAFQKHAAALNAEIVAVSDLWRLRREEAVAYFKEKFQQDVTVYRNNEEM